MNREDEQYIDIVSDLIDCVNELMLCKKNNKSIENDELVHATYLTMKTKKLVHDRFKKNSIFIFSIDLLCNYVNEYSR